MKIGDKICHQVHLKSAKEREAYLRREGLCVEGIPKIILGKIENNVQEVWIDDIRNEPIGRLKEFGQGGKGLHYARILINACAKLASIYGHFIINQNMIFFNRLREIFVWINPDLLQNQVKIYLSPNSDGELAMVQSINIYLKLWIKSEIGYFGQAKTFESLIKRFQEFREKAQKQMSSNVQGKNYVGVPSKQFFANRKQAALQTQGNKCDLINENKSNKGFKGRSPSEKDPYELNEIGKALSSKVKFASNLHSKQADKNILKNKTTLSRNGDQVSQRDQFMQQHDMNYEHKTFHEAQKNVSISKGSSFKPSSYFPNKTASSSNGIVNYILSNISKEDEPKHNKILLTDQEMEELERDQRARMKSSLTGIGEELNDLFTSWMAEEDKQESITNVEQDLQKLLE